MTATTYAMAVLLGATIGIAMGLVMVITLVPDQEHARTGRVIVLPAAPLRDRPDRSGGQMPSTVARAPVGAVAPGNPPDFSGTEAVRAEPPILFALGVRPKRKPDVPEPFLRRRAEAHQSLRKRLMTAAAVPSPAQQGAAAPPGDQSRDPVFGAVAFTFGRPKAEEPPSPLEPPESEAVTLGYEVSLAPSAAPGAAPGAVLAVPVPSPAAIQPPAPDRPEGLATARRETVTIAAVGDIMLGADVKHAASQDLPPVPALHADLARIIRAADLAIGNLEGVIANPDAGLAARGCGTNCYRFLMPGQAARRLREAGFDLLGLANNHGLDFGTDGQLHTMAHLRLSKLGYAGLKRDDADVVLRRVGDLVVGYIAFGTHRCCLDYRNRDDARRRIMALAKVSDLQVVSFHGGAEGVAHERLPKGREFYLGQDRGDVVAFGRMAVEAGADLVVGSGPHVPRALEVHDGRLIAYSLGNFWTLRDMSVVGAAGLAPILVARLARTGQLRDYTVHSARQRGAGPRPDPEAAAWKRIVSLTRQDLPDAAETLARAATPPDASPPTAGLPATQGPAVAQPATVPRDTTTSTPIPAQRAAPAESTTTAQNAASDAANQAGPVAGQPAAVASSRDPG